MKIYFDYEEQVNDPGISKHLAKIITATKSSIHTRISPLFDELRNRSESEGYILITIAPRGYAKQVFGFDAELRKKLATHLDDVNLADIVKHCLGW